MSDKIDLTPWENHDGPPPDFDSPAYPVFDSGVTWTIGQLAVVLSVDCNDFSWDAATEEYDGDVRAVIGNAITAALGEEWSALRAELEALRAENERLREPVTVKPLAWEDFSERSSKATAMLLTSYMVQRWSCGRFDLSISAPGYSTGLEGAGGFYDTMDAAKAAAQADFESRIRAALETKKGPGD